MFARPSPLAAEVRELNDELRRTLEALRQKRKRTEELADPDDAKRKPVRRSAFTAAETIRQLGSNTPFVVVDQGGGDGGKLGSPNDCKRLGNSPFEQIAYLTCRCKRGDEQACTTASALQAAHYGSGKS